MRKVLKEPLLHFLVLGAVLFALFSWVDNNAAPREIDEIVVTPGRIENLVNGFQKTWQRPPTESELDGLINEFVHEEILYREALAMGLDRDDTIVRRRMRQKLEFITEDIIALPKPSEENLATYLQDHMEVFRFDEELSFQHVFLNPDTRGDTLDADAGALLGKLRQDASSDASEMGDRFMLGYDFETATAFEIEKAFGRTFIRGLLRQPEGMWSGPIASGYGMHLVYINHRTHARTPTLDEVREKVTLEWKASKRKELNEAFFGKLRDRYVVTIAESVGMVLRDVATRETTE